MENVVRTRLEHTAGIIGQQIHNGFYIRVSEELDTFMSVENYGKAKAK